MLVVIPPRGGSKGLPGKNIKSLNGKPLIYYTIEAARKVVPDENIIVSTDCEEIKCIVESLRVPFLRSSKLGADNSGTYEVVLHALQWYENHIKIPEKVLLLQPTSPFRNEYHIKRALEIYKNFIDIDMVTSVTILKNSYYTMMKEDKNGFLAKLNEKDYTRRQDSPEFLELNGAIYIANTKSLKEISDGNLKKVKKFVMDEISSLDIDTEMDWKLAEIFSGPLTNWN